MSVKLTMKWRKDIFKCELSKIKIDKNKFTIRSCVTRNTFLGKEVDEEQVFIPGKNYEVDLSNSTNEYVINKYPVKPDVDVIFTDIQRIMDQGMFDILPATRYDNQSIDKLVNHIVYLLFTNKINKNPDIYINLQSKTITSSLNSRYPINYNTLSDSDFGILFN